MATAFGRAKKVMEQLEKLRDDEADDLIDGGYIADVREAKQSGTIPDREAFRRFLGLDRCLRVLGTVELPAREASFTAADYFQTKDGLYVWDGFKNRVLSVAATAGATSASQVTSFELLKDTLDEKIRAELPEGHVFTDVTVFCSRLAGMLDRQAGGKEGPLLINGYANIFYVQVSPDEVLAVRAGWHRAPREWSVDAYPLGDGVWNAGRRVFSAAAVA